MSIERDLELHRRRVKTAILAYLQRGSIEEYIAIRREQGLPEPSHPLVDICTVCKLALAPEIGVEDFYREKAKTWLLDNGFSLDIG